MPARRGSMQDKYPNRAYNTCTMSAANTLTFSQIQFGVGLFQGVALIIHRLEYSPTAASWRELVAATDAMYLVVTNRDDLTAVNPTNQSILVYDELTGIAAVAGNAMKGPITHDFSTMPGGGLIVPANPLYIGMQTSGAAAASSVRSTLFCTFKQLTDAEYVELVQTIMPANI